MEIGSEEQNAGPSLEEFVGQEFGDFTPAKDDASTPEPTPALAGAAPADAPPPDAPAADAPPPTPATTAPATTDAPPDAATAADDPLAGSTSLSYRVDGQEKTYDGIKILKDGGAVISDDATLADLQRKLGERDHLAGTNATLYKNSQALERLTEWKTTGADGKESVLTGRQGIEAQRVVLGQTLATLQVLAPIFQTKDLRDHLVRSEDGAVTFSPQFVESLKLRSDVAERDARDAIRTHMATLATGSAESAAPDIGAIAPQVIQQTVATLGADIKALTPESVAFLTDLLPRFIRPATPEDRRLNPALTLGESVVDTQFHKLVEQQVAQRKSVADTARTTATATMANAARLAAARPKPAAPKPAVPQKPTDTRVKDADAGWDMMEGLALSRLKATG